MPPKNISTAPNGHDGEVAYGVLNDAAIEDLPRCFSNHFALEAAQLDAGATCCDLDYLCAGGIAVCRQRFTRHLHFQGALQAGWFALGFVAGVDGRFVRDGRLRFGEAGHLFKWFLQPGENLMLVLIERGKFPVSVCENGDLLKKLAVRNNIAVWRAKPGALEQVLAEFQNLLDRAKRGEPPTDRELFEKSVLEAVVALLGGVGEVSVGAPPAGLLVDRALTVAENLPQPFRIADLCGTLRVSQRTLCGAFNKITGLGPHSYFLRQRLSAARHLLAGAEGDDRTVTRAAMDSGFTELGRFAGRYSRLFGEKPSHTLRRPRRDIMPLSA